MFPRTEKAINRLRNVKPSICLEKAKIMTEVFIRTEGEPLVLREAKAFKEICEKKTIFVEDDELIVGHPASQIAAAALDPDVNYWILSEKLDTISSRETDAYAISEDQKRLFKQFIEPYWKGRSFWDVFLKIIPEDLRKLVDSGAIVLTNGRETPNHVLLVPNYGLILKIGIDGIREKINKKLTSLDLAKPGDYEKWLYLNALLIVCDGIISLAKRYSELANRKAEKEQDQRRKAELKKIAEICEFVPANPARTFWEAIQSLWFYHTCLLIEYNNASMNLGRLDQYLYPYYRKDVVEEKRITEKQALELVECLLVKLNEVMYLIDKGYKIVAARARFQNVTVGGITCTGQDATNELSYLLLEAMKEIRLPQPHFAVKYNRRKNPDLVLFKAVELASLGTGHPQFFNDEAGIKYLMNWGIPFEDAYNWSPNSCKDLSLMGKIGSPRVPVLVNLALALEVTITEGFARGTKSLLPVPRTGDPAKFKTFEEFKDALRKQMAYFIKKAAEVANIVETMIREQYPILLASLSFEDCIENAKDCTAGGAKYNPGGEIAIGGHADLLNSLIAIKKLIYDEKKITWRQLLEALEHDFKRYEEIRRLCLAAPKYGNDIQEIDEIAPETFQFLGEEAKKYKSQYGGSRALAGMAAAAHILLGSMTGALPSGGRAWTPLADGASPIQGTDVKGPAAVLNDLSKCCLDIYYAPLLNMKLDPSIFRDQNGLWAFVNLMKTWADLDIYHIQFNAVSSKTLKEAQKHSEKHRDLLVRVSGHCAYFVELPKEIQNEIIARTT